MEVKNNFTRLLPVHVQVNDGKLAKVTVVVKEESPTDDQAEEVRELTGDEVLVLSRQTEIAEGQPVKVTMQNW
jgi:hypothetical protein